MAQEQPLVSVVVAAFRQPAFLNEALRSIVAQTYRAIEIIVVDDASGDEFTRQYELPHNARLIVHEQRRATAAITRNTGILAAAGEYVAFLDQDDVWVSDKISRQVEQMQREPDAVLTFGHFRWVDDHLDELKRQHEPPVIEQDALRQMLRKNFIQCPSQVMIRKSVLDRIGPFDATIRGSADWEMWIRLAAAGPILSDPSVMTLYRQHDQQWSRDSLMVRKGAVVAMEKTAGWLPKSRPDLKWAIYKRWARWLRELARAQFHSGDESERSQAMKTLRRAMKVWPLDMQSYGLMMRAMVGVE